MKEKATYATVWPGAFLYRCVCTATLGSAILHCSDIQLWQTCAVVLLWLVAFECSIVSLKSMAVCYVLPCDSANKPQDFANALPLKITASATPAGAVNISTDSSFESHGLLSTILLKDELLMF